MTLTPSTQNIRRATLFIASCAVMLELSTTASAKDLTGHFGVGFNTQIGDVPTVAVRYGLPFIDPAVNLQIEGNFGFSAYKSQTSQMFAGGRLLYAAVVEDNMNLYLAGGGGFVSQAGEGVFRLQPGAEVQFFPFGLENLGVCIGWGINIDMGSGESGTRTVGSMLTGAQYWF